MITILLIVLLATLAGMIAWGMFRPQHVIQFPLLAAVAFAGYILPQMFAIINDYRIPESALYRTYLIAILCLIATHLGYTRNRRPARLFGNWQLDETRLLWGATALVVSGSYFFYQVSRLSAEVSLEMGGAWRGPITIYVFLSTLTTYGFLIAVILYLRRPNIHALMLIGIGILMYLDRIVLQGRRSATVQFFLIVVMSLWFNKRILPPRLLVAVMAFLGILLFNSIGDYRATMLERDRTTYTGAGFSEVLAINYWENLKSRFSSGAYDVINAVYYMEAVSRDLSFSYGTGFWDGLINKYVPGQIVGYDVKQSLMFRIGFQGYGSLQHIQKKGTTLPGFAVVYGAFGYFGPIQFFLIGLILSRLFKAAENHNFIAQILVILATFPALLAFSFSPNRFFLEFVSYFIFIGPVLLWAKKKRTRNKSVPFHLPVHIHEG